MAGTALGLMREPRLTATESTDLVDDLFAFVRRCARQTAVMLPRRIRPIWEFGYLSDHITATFHMAHYFRLVGQPTPKAESMVARVLHHQIPDGG